MFSRLAKQFDYDWVLLTAVAFLLTFGLMAIYSLTLNSERSGFNNFEKQLIFLAMGLVTFFVISRIDYRIWKSYSWFFYGIGVILMVAVLLFGRNIRGTSGWFDLGFFNFQPAETMKLFVILVLAKYLSGKNRPTLSNIQIISSFLLVLVPVFLAVKQPDMGSAMVMLMIWVGMVFLSGLNRKQIFVLLAMGFWVPVLSWNMVLKDYQKVRINSFLDPSRDPLGSGYNVIQSTVAVGSGGIWGKGLGHGSQSRLNFLPEKHTDFIFATIAEESGLVGSALVLGLFAVLLLRLKRIADKSRDAFGQLIIGGIITMIFFQLFVNIGMNLGIMPVAGLSLPFLSYGGSFLIIVLFCIGLAQNIWKKRIKRVMALMSEVD